MAVRRNSRRLWWLWLILDFGVQRRAAVLAIDAV
jgi:hypothetical protein